jgi:hypothetical protein
MNVCRLRAQVERHFRGTISPDGEHAMREHLPACSSCRQLYQRHLLLSELDPRALPSWERLALGLGLGPRRATPRSPAALLVLAGTAAAALFVLPFLRPSRVDDYSSRGHVVESAAPASRVLVYEVPDHGRPARVATTLRYDEELAFAYENGAGKHRLAIFGVDEHGHVFWFHPGWLVETDDPIAIPIESDGRRHELTEAVRHRFDGTHLEIRSVFLDEAISVREIEEMLKRTPSGPLPIAGAIQSSLSLELVR